MPSVLTPATVTAPSGIDGRGEVATLNDSTSGTFVGYIFKATGFGSPAVRISKDSVVEGPGAVFGTDQWGERSFTLEIAMARAATVALSDALFQKLCRACNAKALDATLAWTDAGAVAKQIGFRLEQGPSDPDPENAHTLVGGIAPDPRIYSGGSEHTLSASTSLSISNAGNEDSPARFTIASPSATCVLTNSTTSKTFTFTGLNGGGTVTIDFKAKTITQGGVSKLSAVSWPSSVWWDLAPASNTVTCTNAATPFWRDAWSSA